MESTTMKKALLLLPLLIVLVGCPGTGGVPSLWWIAPREFGSFTQDVQRNAESPEEENLIAIAEAVYPAREDVVAVFVGEIPEEPLWWYDTFDDVRIPYAITAEAIEYYSDLVDQWQEEADADCPWCVTWLSCSLEYVADIEYHETYENEGETFSDVYVVTMNLHWGAYCGPVCAHWFEKDRTVVLTPDGEVLNVFGDGPTSFIVS